MGSNAQGKTSRPGGRGAPRARPLVPHRRDAPSCIRRGAPLRCWRAGRGVAGRARGRTLEVEVHERAAPLPRGRPRGDGRASTTGRLEAVVYSTDRLRVVRGQHAGAAAVPRPRARRPSGRPIAQACATSSGCVLQRNAALGQRRARPAGVERALRGARRGASRRGAPPTWGGFDARSPVVFRPAGEEYDVSLPEPAPGRAGEPPARCARRDIAPRPRAARSRGRRSLVGPHRDAVALHVNGQEASPRRSSGQARSLLLALSLAALEVYREESGRAAVALLDDLDSELDEERAGRSLPRRWRGRGQALVTTAHPGWAERLARAGPSLSGLGGGGPVRLTPAADHPKET